MEGEILNNQLLFKKILSCVKNLHSISIPDFLINFWDIFYEWKRKTNNLYNDKIIKVLNVLKKKLLE